MWQSSKMLKHRGSVLIIIAAMLVMPSVTIAQTYKDTVTILMRSTFKVVGPSREETGGNISWNGFLAKEAIN